MMDGELTPDQTRATHEAWDAQVAVDAMGVYLPDGHRLPSAPETVRYLIREATLYGIRRERARVVMRTVSDD